MARVSSTPPNQAMAWVLPISPQGKGRQLLDLLREAQGVSPVPSVVSLSPPGEARHSLWVIVELRKSSEQGG